MVLIGSALTVGGLLAVGAGPNDAAETKCPLSGGTCDKVAADGCTKGGCPVTAASSKAGCSSKTASECESGSCPVVAAVAGEQGKTGEKGEAAKKCCGSAACAKKAAEKAAKHSVVLCGGCGHVKGSKACCAKDAAK